jgi:hypothetical protein
MASKLAIAKVPLFHIVSVSVKKYLVLLSPRTLKGYEGSDPPLTLKRKPYESQSSQQ